MTLGRYLEVRYFASVLTETDIHYLVGLLSLAAATDDADIELGSRVYDSAAETRRDVDVTVSVKAADGQVTAFKGLEVKKHSRKLDSTHVEGLATKLNDMEDVTHRAIVSASGYTRPAIRKAAKHKIDLYEIVDWKSKDGGFDFFQAETVPFIHTNLVWGDGPHARFNPSSRYSKEEMTFFDTKPPVFFGDSEQRSTGRNLKDLADNLLRGVQNMLFDRLNGDLLKVGEHQGVRIVVNISDAPYIEGPKGRIVLTTALFTGSVFWKNDKVITEYKILRKVGEKRGIAGCAIAEVPVWGLIGLSVANDNRTLSFVRIPISDRNKKKIYRQKLARGKADVEDCSL